MASDPKPSALNDLRKGLGLLFRAAKTTLEKLPTGELEEAVITSAKEMGRALENVTHTVEKQIFGRPTGDASARRDGEADAPKPGATDAASSGQAEKPRADEPEGTTSGKSH